MNLLNLLDRFGTWLAIQLYWVGQWFEPWDPRKSRVLYDETGWYRPGCSDHHDF